MTGTLILPNCNHKTGYIAMKDLAQSMPERSNAFSHILCWVDGSSEACHAARQAAQLAKTLGARLSFVAVGQELTHDEGYEEYARFEGLSEPTPSFIENNALECLGIAMSAAASIGIHGAVRLTRTGNPATAICDAARAQGADLLVIGRRRSRRIEGWLGRSYVNMFAKGCSFAVLAAG